MVDVQSSLSSGAAGPRRPSSLEALRTPKNRCVGGATHVPNLRDGPLDKLWGGRGIFEPQEFFFVSKFLV